MINKFNQGLTIILIIFILIHICFIIQLMYTNSYYYKEKQFKKEIILKLKINQELTDFEYARMLSFTDRNKIFKVVVEDVEYRFNLKDFSNIQISTLKKDH